MPQRSALVTALIVERPMCVPCIAAKSGLGVADVTATLAAVGAGLRLHDATGRCRECGRTAAVMSLERPGEQPLAPREGGLWDFLEQHRGKLFCSACVAVALGTSKRLDRALIAAEARGARRQHGPCSECGKGRLLCGLG